VSSRPPPLRVPTLTEVVEIGALAPAPAALPPPAPSPAVDVDLHVAAGVDVNLDMDAGAPTPPQPTPGSPPPLTLDDAAARRIYADLMRQVDLMIEYRLREALAPALRRATDILVQDARNELASTLRDVVARAVAQELSRHRGR